MRYELVILSGGIEGFSTALLAQFYGLKVAFVALDVNNYMQNEGDYLDLDEYTLRIFSMLNITATPKMLPANLYALLRQRVGSHKQLGFYQPAHLSNLVVKSTYECCNLSYLDTDNKANNWNFLADFLIIGKNINNLSINNFFINLKYIHFKPNFKAVAYIRPALLARRWRYENCFLLGNAAYQFPTFIDNDNKNNNVSIAFSNFLQDAQNLLWKLFLLINQRANPQLLTSYQGERQGIVQDKLLADLQKLEADLLTNKKNNLFNFFANLFAQKTTISNPQTKLSFGIIANSTNQLARYHNQSRKFWGTYLPNFGLTGENTLPFYLDRLQTNGFLLMAWQKNPVDWLTVADIDFLAHLGCAFLQIIPAKNNFSSQIRYTSTAQDEKTNHWQQWFKIIQTDFILIRPDKIIFGTANNMPELSELLRQLKLKLAYKFVSLPDLTNEEMDKWAEKAQI